MKMSAEVRWLWCAIIFIFEITEIFANIPHKRFEYKYSFKPPYLAQKDGSIPFWEYGGNAIASEENVRIAPSLRSQKGAIWTKTKTNFDWWEANVVFRVTGRGRVGADGLAFWYTDATGNYDGPVFGSSDQWTGLGIFFDSFDNDNKHNNPYISAVINDGTKVFDHQNDGTTQQLAGCLRDFRNKPFPTRAKIEYYKNTLTVLFHNGMTNNNEDFDVCLRAENVFLPKNGHFGISAATGGLADDHDALMFLTYSLHPPGQVSTQSGRVSDEEQQKLSQEYQDYQRKLDQQKEDYRKEHPDEMKDKEQNLDDWFEDVQQRELRQIFSGQSQMFDALRDLNRKLDEVIGRQERSLSLLSAVQTGGVPIPGPVGQPQGGQPPMAMVDTIRRHEVDTVLNNQRDIVSAAREIKSFVTEIHQKSNTIIQNQSKQPTAHVQSVGYDVQALVNEMKDGLNSVKRDVAATAQRLTGGGQGCPTQQACLTTTIFIVFIVIQLLLMLGYALYRDNREAQAKKFY